MIFLFSSIPNRLGVQVGITNNCNFTLGGDYPLGIPLITPIPQSWSESTQLLKCSSVAEIALEDDLESSE